MGESGQSSAMLARRLYRLLLRAARPLFHKNHADFLAETIAVFRSQVGELSQGERILLLTKSEGNSLESLRNAFRNGAKDDIQICIDIIPNLLRYLRAAKILHDDDLFKIPRKLLPLGSPRSPYSLSSASLLSSKLFCYERDMKDINFDRMHRAYLDGCMVHVRRSINQTMLDRRREAMTIGVNVSTEELRRMRVYYMLLSLDRLFWLWDINQIDEIDRIFPAFAKFRMEPQHRYIGDLSFYTSIVNNMTEYELEAYGSVINDSLYIKLAPLQQSAEAKGDPSFFSNPFLRSSNFSFVNDLPSRPEKSGLKQGMSQSMSARVEEPFFVTSTVAAQKAAHMRRSQLLNSQQTSPLESEAGAGIEQEQTVFTHRLSAMQLQGQHFFADRFYEVVLQYHPDSYTLEAVMHLDPNKSLFAQSAKFSPDDGRWRVPKGHVLWRIDLSQFHNNEEDAIPDISTKLNDSQGNHNRNVHHPMPTAHERRHWLFLDREYQGVEVPVPPEFYDLPASLDGRYHPSESETSLQENKSQNEVFGEHGMVPSICYIKFRRPPSAQRIENCLLPHMNSPRLQETESSGKTVEPSSKEEKVKKVHYPRSWDSIRQQVSARQGFKSTRTTSNSSLQSSSYIAPVTSTHSYQLPLRSDASDLSTVSHTSRMNINETLYHKLPSFLEVEVRFCRRKEEMDTTWNMASASSIVAQEEDDEEEAEMTVSDGDEVWAKYVEVEDEENLEDDGVSSVVTVIPALSDWEFPDHADDFKSLHNDLISQASAQRNEKREDSYVFETVRYGHILDLDGAWIKVTNDGLRPVFHSELFPPEELSPTQRVQPITSAGAMKYIAKVLEETFHNLGSSRPGFSTVGNGIQGISDSEPTSSSSKLVSNSGDWLASNPPTDPLRQRYGHSIGGESTRVGRRLAGESAYWAALHNYFSRRQRQLEVQYQAKSKKKSQNEDTKAKNSSENSSTYNFGSS
jgi:hypothetical protein